MPTSQRCSLLATAPPKVAPWSIFLVRAAHSLPMCILGVDDKTHTTSSSHGAPMRCRAHVHAIQVYFFVLFVLFTVQYASERDLVLFFISLLPDSNATSWPCSLVGVRVVQFSGDWLVRAVHYWDPGAFCFEWQKEGYSTDRKSVV